MRILETALYAENLAETADLYQHVLGLERFAAAPGRQEGAASLHCLVLLARPKSFIVKSRIGKPHRSPASFARRKSLQFHLPRQRANFFNHRSRGI